jgi:polyhydroxyalkanoate synthase subunit PhaC
MTDTSQRDGTAEQRNESGWSMPSNLFGVDGPFADFMRSADPFAMFQRNMELYQTFIDIALGNSNIAPDARDWRFQDETWAKNPFYRRLSQAYLAMTDAVEKMIPEDLSNDDRARAQLAADIVTSAFSPTNTLIGNPAAASPRAFATSSMTG